MLLNALREHLFSFLDSHEDMSYLSSRTHV